VLKQALSPFTPRISLAGDAMNAKEAIQTALKGTQQVLSWYVSDLSDADLLVRPAPNANHIAWQLGHLAVSETMLGKNIPGANYPELPAGFAEQHNKSTAPVEPPKGFRTKEEYLGLYNKLRNATLSNLGKLSEADLDKPTSGDIAKYAPTVGALILLISNHTLMHAGQFTVVRRKLGKPVLF
jgi:hypothetical protein